MCDESFLFLEMIREWLLLQKDRPSHHGIAGLFFPDSRFFLDKFQRIDRSFAFFFEGLFQAILP